MLLASHLVMHGYGHWLPNDLRGSGSTEVRKEELRDLGPAHFRRRPNHEQPSMQELRAFYREAEPKLQFDPLWYRERERLLVARGIREALARHGYSISTPPQRRSGGSS